MNIQVYHHGYCHDGFGAAWVAYQQLGDDATYHHMLHGEKLSSKVHDADVIYFLDAAPPLEDTKALLQDGKKIIIIDHHISNIDKYRGFNHSRLATRFDVAFSAAVLTWFHFFGTEPLPKLLRHIQDYDLWTLELPNTKEILAGLRLEEFKFSTWSALMENTEYLKDRGYVALATERRAYKRQIKELRYKTIMGIKIPMINIACCWNEAMEELKQTLNVPVVGYYFDRANIRVYGLRGDGSIDVRELAQSMGGGGHHDAAGFQTALEC